MRKGLILLTALSIGSLAYGQELCGPIFSSQPLVVRQTNLTQPRVAMGSEQLLSQISTWKQQLASASSSQAYRRTQGKISELAAQLIKNHQNQEFFFLASQIEFPLNRMSYEDYQTSFFYYGKSLLEEAILAKNYEVYRRLPQLARENRWSEDHEVVVYQWNQRLARAVVEDPVFSKDLLVLNRAVGPEFHHRMAEYGYLKADKREQLTDIAATKDIRELGRVLRDLFPSGDLGVEIYESATSSPLLAVLKYEYVHGHENASSWMQMSIKDPREYSEGILSSGYKKQNKFNLQFHTFENNQLREIRDREKNWIRDMEVTTTKVRILIERDEAGVFYDRGTRFQELIFALSPDGRVDKVTIKNGDQLLFHKLWSSQTVQVPKSTFSYSRVSFGGEDTAHTQIGN